MSEGGQFTRLFSPLQVGGRALRNRITPRWIDFLAERAKGGAGMVITERPRWRRVRSSPLSILPMKVASRRRPPRSKVKVPAWLVNYGTRGVNSFGVRSGLPREFPINPTRTVGLSRM